MTDPLRMPQMTVAQEQGWLALFDLSAFVPRDWTLVGGQLVHLWCAERGSNIARPTDDVDAVLDVRARPQALWDVTSALHDLGFEPVTESGGLQHRWIRDAAVIDVLIPRHLGPRASMRRGRGGGRTIATPGAQKVLNRSESVRVEVAGRVGTVQRPTLVGALVGKSAAFTVALDANRARHLGDLAVLSTLLRPADTRGVQLDRRERALLANGIGAARASPRAWSSVPGGRQGLDRAALIL